MSQPIKTKKYLVPVRTHVSAEMIVFANSKNEAWEIAERDMEKSLKRQLSEVKPHPLIKNFDGYTEAMKSSIEIIHE